MNTDITRNMAGYNSHDEDYEGNDQPKKRQKRFAFQSFAQRIAKVGCQYMAGCCQDDGASGCVKIYYSLM